jgi:hypothetical protein
MNIDNSSSARVEQFKYLGTVLINQSPVQEEIKCIFNSGNECYHLVQNLFVFQLVIKKYKD